LLLPVTSAYAQESGASPAIDAYFNYLIGAIESDGVQHPRTFQFEDQSGKTIERPIKDLRALVLGCAQVSYSRTLVPPYEFKWSGRCATLPSDQLILIRLAGTRTAVEKVEVRVGVGATVVPPVPFYPSMKHK
jgi:hypothetical protein